tara:strand:- start:31 stop:330 length:300 start_codon:yes stop_codon:yes gene_type:complete
MFINVFSYLLEIYLIFEQFHPILHSGNAVASENDVVIVLGSIYFDSRSLKYINNLIFHGQVAEYWCVLFSVSSGPALDILPLPYYDDSNSSIEDCLGKD